MVDVEQRHTEEADRAVNSTMRAADGDTFSEGLINIARAGMARGLATKEAQALTALQTALDGLPEDGTPIHVPMVRLVLEAVVKEVRGG